MCLYIQVIMNLLLHTFFMYIIIISYSMVFLVQFGKANTRGFFKDFNYLIVFEKHTRACLFPHCTQNHILSLAQYIKFIQEQELTKFNSVHYSNSRTILKTPNTYSILNQVSITSLNFWSCLVTPEFLNLIHLRFEVLKCSLLSSSWHQHLQVWLFSSYNMNDPVYSMNQSPEVVPEFALPLNLRILLRVWRSNIVKDRLTFSCFEFLVYIDVYERY